VLELEDDAIEARGCKGDALVGVGLGEGGEGGLAGLECLDDAVESLGHEMLLCWLSAFSFELQLVVRVT
jgi:hypothetical protein